MVMLKCIECGAQVSANARVCPTCGTPYFKTKQQTELEKQREIASVMEDGPQFMDWVWMIGIGGTIVAFILLLMEGF